MDGSAGVSSITEYLAETAATLLVGSFNGDGSYHLSEYSRRAVRRSTRQVEMALVILREPDRIIGKFIPSYDTWDLPSFLEFDMQ